MKWSEKKIHVAAILTLMLCMLANCWHPHLWGPDEPREAEIARETFQDASYVVPHFNGIPFVEKPPLYYDVSALIYSVSPHPGSLRLHSALLGILMLAALYLFAAKKCGPATALGAGALCLAMPQFYRAAHWILLDIGVGAWVTAGLVCYGLWSLDEDEKRSALSAVLFFVFAALGMLTKGVITLVYLGCIILPHWLFFRRRKLPPWWTILFFLVPVLLWIWLFYREGGVCFLHEHFVNNTVGRLLHREFRLAGSPVTISDVGHRSPFWFYFKRLPNMFGAVIVLLPFAVAWAWRVLGWRSFRLRLPARMQQFWDRLTRPHTEEPEPQKELLRFLLLWSFVPLFVFSIPAIKEVTYLLPSYAGIALLAARYAGDRLGGMERGGLPWVRGLILPLLGLVLTVQVLVKYSLLLFWGVAALFYGWLLWEFVRCIRRRDFRAAAPVVLGAMIGGVLLGNTPELMVRTRLDRKCYCRLADKVWTAAGAHPLCLTMREESIRGALPFYGRRNVRVLPKEKLFLEAFAAPGDTAFLVYEGKYEKFLQNPDFRRSLGAYRVIYTGVPEKADTFVLLVPDAAAKTR